MTECERDNLIAMASVFGSALVVGFMLIGAGTLDYQLRIKDYTLKTNNYQTALKMITECRLQPNINPDVICGKIPTWEQYK
jgi:hypothetical protein